MNGYSLGADPEFCKTPCTHTANAWSCTNTAGAFSAYVCKDGYGKDTAGDKACKQCADTNCKKCPADFDVCEEC